MRTLLIGYDLNNAGKNYDALFDKIKELGDGWWHHLDSTWIIKSSFTVETACKALISCLDRDDELLVIDITGDPWWSFGLTDRGLKWLHNNMKA